MSTAITIIDCDGQPCAVVTTQKPGESAADFAARHRAAVEAQREACEAGEGCGGEALTAQLPDGAILVVMGDDRKEAMAALLTEPS